MQGRGRPTRSQPASLQYLRSVASGRIEPAAAAGIGTGAPVFTDVGTNRQVRVMTAGRTVGFTHPTLGSRSRVPTFQRRRLAPLRHVYSRDLQQARRRINPIYLLYLHYLSCQVVQPGNLTQVFGWMAQEKSSQKLGSATKAPPKERFRLRDGEWVVEGVAATRSLVWFKRRLQFRVAGVH